MTGNPSPHVFISYASVDRVGVLPVVGALKQAGVPVWFDRADIPGSATYGAAIAAGIRDCRALVLLCSAASLASPNVKQEIMLAWKYQRPYVPLLLEETTFPPDLEYWLEGWQWVEVLDHPEATWLPNVLRALAEIETPREGRAATGRDALGAVNLPTPLTALHGREAAVAEVAQLLTRHRLVTLTGPGGTGKTRLAIAAARAAAPGFPDGAVFVDLSPIADPELVVSAIIAALGSREAPGRSPLEGLKASLGEQHRLLVLDNFEQVTAAAAAVADVIAACPRLAVLVTSRVRLQVRGERSFAVDPLPVPAPLDRLTPEDPIANPAVRLFVDRARDSDATFQLTAEHTPAVVGICRRLDGLPLAIELAAARTRVLSPNAILDRLGSRLRLLTSGADGGPERQRTLRAAIAWSYDLLTAEEQLLFRRLAVFVDGFVLDAADAVVAAPDGPVVDALDGVASLVDKSLLLRHAERGGEPRFGMLETIREFALERLEADSGAHETGRRHATWAVHLAEHIAQVGPRHRTSVFGNRADVGILDAEAANLRAALTWLTGSGDAESALRLAAALGGYWNLRGHLSDGQEWLERTLAHDDGSRPIVRARALQWLSMSVGTRGDFARAAALIDEALAISRAIGDAEGIVAARLNQGFAALHGRGDAAMAIAIGEESLALSERAALPWGATMARGLLAQVAEHQGAVERAVDLYDRIVVDVRRHGGDEYLAALSLHALGVLTQTRGDDDRARSLLAEAVRLFYDLGDLGKVAWSLEAIAGASGTFDPDQAGRFFGAASALRTAINVPLPAAERAGYDRALGAVRAAMGDDPFAAAWVVGSAQPLPAILAEAAAIVPSVADPA